MGLRTRPFFVLTTSTAENAGTAEIGTPYAGPPPKEIHVQAEMQKLQGTWNVVALEVEAMKMGESSFQGSKIVVKGDTFTTVSMGADYSGTIKVDATSSPKTLDLTFAEGPHQGNTAHGIYGLDDSRWIICLGFAGRDRPKEFVTTPGCGHALETLMRATSEPAKRPQP